MRRVKTNNLEELSHYLVIMENIKTSDKFICEKCDYGCVYYSDYERHVNTAKHKRKILANNNTTTLFMCDCGKEYTHNSSLCKHKRKCTYNRHTNKN